MKKNNRSLHLLKVTPKDEKLLFTWANEKLVRKWSFHNLPISRLDHNNWFRKNLKLIDYGFVYRNDPWYP